MDWSKVSRESTIRRSDKGVMIVIYCIVWVIVMIWESLDVNEMWSCGSKSLSEDGERIEWSYHWWTHWRHDCPRRSQTGLRLYPILLRRRTVIILWLNVGWWTDVLLNECRGTPIHIFRLCPSPHSLSRLKLQCPLSYGPSQLPSSTYSWLRDTIYLRVILI